MVYLHLSWDHGKDKEPCTDHEETLGACHPTAACPVEGYWSCHICWLFPQQFKVRPLCILPELCLHIYKLDVHALTDQLQCLQVRQTHLVESLS